MDKKEWSEVLREIEQLIGISEPLWAEYLRGYHRGIRVHVLGVSDDRTEEHQHLMLMARSCLNGDPHVDWYARGYRHGFEGKKPEGPSTYYSSLRIVSNAWQYYEIGRGPQE